ncbi:DNA topoisomerase IV subunit A [Atopococcus tabaci]|uniref:DNA topoisomerase IV subunit A n=1 Tax=Atopococcus tabaci TaxID=269774 RepID=UPI00040EEFCB|nr:DNA topoisomerase IV subunit A [Atopococcus tabaci]
MPKRDEIQELSLDEVMGDRFGRYSRYIIQERAIPDIRDGLKPVQRRILYSMSVEGNTHEKGFRKSAKTVGNVIGNYHPHGDTSVYDAMVRLSQEWKMREPLIEMHGNNGSMDGDPPAAMRYTEARMSKIAGEMTQDLEKETVEWVLNFDDTTHEPTVMPARFPNLLVNGATGISAGYATDIPPHNLGEVIDAAIYLIKHPGTDTKKLMSFIKGPDFPTGGIVQGEKGLQKAYETGKGKIVVRSKTMIEDIRGGRQQIVVTEIPYEVNKANIVRKIDDIKYNKRIDGISEVRDETDRDGLRIVVELKKEANAEGILTYLLKNTDLQISYNLNMVAIDEKRPQQVGLKQILSAYLEHRRTIVTRRTEFDLRKAQNRKHIVDGLIKAVSILDDVIAAIRQSKNKQDAKRNIEAQFGFTEAQAEAIVSLQLYRLSNTDITQLQKEADELDKQIATLSAILADPKKRDQEIIKEMRETKKAYATPRLTEIEEKIEELKVETEVLIAEEDVIVSVTRDGYVKRTSPRSYGASLPEEIGLKEGDHPVLVQQLSTLDQVVLFTNKGNFINRPVYELPDFRWKDLGQHLSQTISLEKEEQIIAAFGLKDFTEEATFVLFSKEGFIKQTALAEFQPKRTYRKKSSVGMKLKTSSDEVVAVYYTDATDKQDVFLVSHGGYGLRYSLKEVPIVGAKAAGVKSMNLKEDDWIVGGTLIDPDENRTHILIVTQRGAVKKMDLSEFDVMARAQRGLLVLRDLKAKPHRVALIEKVEEGEQRTLITDKGESFLLDEGRYSPVDRYNNGSFILDENTDGTPVMMKRDDIVKIDTKE